MPPATNRDVEKPPCGPCDLCSPRPPVSRFCASKDAARGGGCGFQTRVASAGLARMAIELPPPLPPAAAASLRLRLRVCARRASALRRPTLKTDLKTNRTKPGRRAHSPCASSTRHVTTSPSGRGLPGNGRLADWERGGTGPLCIFTLIASLCHMYLERGRNNNPKQQEGRLRFRGGSLRVGAAPAGRRRPALRPPGLRAKRGPGARMGRAGAHSSQQEPPLRGRQHGTRIWGEG